MSCRSALWKRNQVTSLAIGAAGDYVVVVITNSKDNSSNGIMAKKMEATIWEIVKIMVSFRVP